jgi:pyruvate/2-oxoglutarate dehydrogenase complex dihydrolipoamide acyltransferase (E2) component
MSLINDALKKAARQRAQEEGDIAPLMPGGGGRAHSRPPARAQNMVLIGGAAIALVVVSAVVTGIFVSGRSAPKAAAAFAQPAAQKAQPTPETQATAVHIPQISLASAPATHAPAKAAETPAAEAPPKARAAAVAAPPAAATPGASAQVAVRVPETIPQAAATAGAGASQAPTQNPPPAAVAPAPVATPVPVAATAPTPTPAVIQSLGERVQAVIDHIQISGVRYSGADSKAIIDGHIYRVNDLLDRTLGIRLSKFDPDHLTFVDPSGAKYVKSF